jgi:alkanesulfonate monooxygenase SsuD/methylene tetrahydromethanopterin reductase-like flavin-dependent oxidoreductase (luciferase family)
MTIRLGALLLPEHAGGRATAVWRRAEDLGLAHAWTLDHLSWRTLAGRPWFDAMTTLAAAAATTSRIELGTLVTSPSFRHPVTTATQAMTIDQLSGGRFVLGVGAGAAGPDATALGGGPLSPGQRAGRFAEFVTLLDRLLRDPVTTFDGDWFTAHEVRMEPGCVRLPRLPFAVAAAGPRGMRLAARFAGMWVTIGDAAAPGEQDEAAAFGTLRVQVARLTEICEQAGRPPAGLRKLVNLSRVAAAPYASPERLADLVGRCGELGFTDVVLAYPRPHGVFAGDERAFERAVTSVHTGVPAGARTGATVGSMIGTAGDGGSD